jgi:hypothetical protein
MQDKKKPLWKCPKCGRRFANKNQWHSCTKITVAEHLRDKTAVAIEIYKAFEAAVRECGPVRAHPTRTRIGFIARMTFTSASLRARWIDVGLILPYRLDSTRIRKVETYGPSSYGHYLRIRAIDEIDDELSEWLREAYRLGKQEHLEGWR